MILLSLSLMNGFAFETQTAVENSVFTKAIIQKLEGCNVEDVTTLVTEGYLTPLVKNMHKSLDVFNWPDKIADKVSATVDCLLYVTNLGILGSEVSDTELNIAVKLLLDNSFNLVKAFGFDDIDAYTIGFKTSMRYFEFLGWDGELDE